MSWDIVLFNSSEKISSPEEIDETKLIPVDFYNAFNRHFKNIRQKDNHCSINEDNFSIDFFWHNESESNMILNLYGEAALFPIIDLALKNNWQIFDTGLGEMIDLENPAKNGYENFQAYLNQIINNKN